MCGTTVRTCSTERPKSKVPEENGNWLEILIIFGKQTAENVNKLF